MAKHYGLSYQIVRTSIGLRLALGRFFSKSNVEKYWKSVHLQLQMTLFCNPILSF